MPSRLIMKQRPEEVIENLNKQKISIESIHGGKQVKITDSFSINQLFVIEVVPRECPTW